MFAPRGWLSRRFHRQVYRTLRTSDLFDRSFYRRENLHGLARVQDPLWHFVTTGGDRALSPSASFDSEYYLMKNDDVRVARLNPLFHFLEYGALEGRLPLRSAPEARHVATPEASPLRYFITPSLGQKRVSILFDSASKTDTAEEFAVAIQAAADHAKQQSSTLRILYRPQALRGYNISQALSGIPRAIQDALEITEAPTTLTYSDVPFFDDEMSLATSWSSAEALRFATASDKAFVLSAAHGSPTLLRNDAQLRSALREEALTLPAGLDSILTASLRATKPSSQPGIIAWVDSEQFPLAYSLLLEALELFILHRSPQSSTPDITLVGNPGARFAFAEEIEPALLTSEGLSSNVLQGNCVLVLAEDENSSLLALSDQGYQVIHASRRPGAEVGGPIRRVSLKPESIAGALAEVNP